MLRNGWVTSDFVPDESSDIENLLRNSESYTDIAAEDIPCCVDPEFFTDSVGDSREALKSRRFAFQPQIGVVQPMGQFVCREKTDVVNPGPSCAWNHRTTTG